MASLIHVVAFCLANVFLLKNVCLTLSACYYGLTSLWNVRGCFLSFHNGVKKLRIVKRHSGRKNAYLFVLHMFFFYEIISFSCIRTYLWHPVLEFVYWLQDPTKVKGFLLHKYKLLLSGVKRLTVN